MEIPLNPLSVSVFFFVVFFLHRVSFQKSLWNFKQRYLKK